MDRVPCPVCGESADRDATETIYCRNERCGFMGLLPEWSPADE